MAKKKMHRTHRTTVVERLVDAVSRDIFLGKYRPGERLPPIRELAKQMGVTAPTAQRVTDRLGELGLVRARHGSGVTVHDPVGSANLSALPRWVKAYEQHPERARVVLADFLALRRDLTAAMVLALRRGLSEDDLARMHAAVEALAAAPIEDDRKSCAAADIAVVRTALSLRPQIAYSMIANVFEQLLATSAALRKAMYFDIDANVGAYSAALALVADETVDERDLELGLRTLMSSFDNNLLDMFESTLRSQS